MLFAQVKYIERCKAGLWFQRVILALRSSTSHGLSMALDLGALYTERQPHFHWKANVSDLYT